ncbi:unnamed protein product [Arabis nemorensis]|uniref:Uncharacterized protein n=1 Tax=Arabis nemorensis TaxID=586526 RepID=A0A565CGE2_9BRAS|nr:unnamed protein product [Arabis nemorensis]
MAQIERRNVKITKLEIIDAIVQRLEAVADFVLLIAVAEDQIFRVHDAVNRSQTSVTAVLNQAPPPQDDDSDITGMTGALGGR